MLELSLPFDFAKPNNSPVYALVDVVSALSEFAQALIMGHDEYEGRKNEDSPLRFPERSVEQLYKVCHHRLTIML
jgi:hypothetical protein